jgi:hypothetical protein
MPDARLGHDGDGHGSHDLLDHLGIRHASNSSFYPDVCWDTLQGHDRTRSGLFSYSGLVAKGQRWTMSGLEGHVRTCSALTTSMITPPFSMRARPVLTVKLDSALPFVVVAPLEGSSVAILGCGG